MQPSGLLALQLYLVGIPIGAIFASWWLPKTAEVLKEGEKAAMKAAMDPDAPRGDVRDARERMEYYRDNYYWVSRLLEALSSSGRMMIACFVIGLLWPGLLAMGAALYARRVAMNAWDLVSGTYAMCDGCDMRGPWAWTYRRAQIKAAGDGWLVGLPNGEDLCPTCAKDVAVHLPT